MDIYDRIDDMIQNQSLSRRKLALKAGIPPSTFQSMMARKKNMPVEVLDRITRALGTSEDVLWYGRELDREYELVTDTLRLADIVIEQSPHADEYYVYPEGEPEARELLQYAKISDVVHRVLDDAEKNKLAYIQRRLEVEFF